MRIINFFRCVKSVLIRNYSGPHFPAFELNHSEYRHFLRSFEEKPFHQHHKDLLRESLPWHANFFIQQYQSLPG